MQACTHKSARTITVGGHLVIGNISNDTVYNGLIKFFDKKTYKLLEEGTYLNGIKNGVFKRFNSNGTLSSEFTYRDDNENGIANIYNEFGKIYSSDYYYYGLRCGNSVKYQGGKLKSYSFFSLDNSRLMHFEYDSIMGRHLNNIVDNFYFYSVSQYSNRVQDSSTNLEIFLYTPNPPMQEFNYSLVKVDKKYNVTTTLENFDKAKPWSKFSIVNKFDTLNGSFAIKLRIIDTINKNNITLFKILKLN